MKRFIFKSLVIGMTTIVFLGCINNVKTVGITPKTETLASTQPEKPEYVPLPVPTQSIQEIKREENSKIIEEYYVNYPKVPNFAYMFNIPAEKEDIDIKDETEFHDFSTKDLPDDARNIYIKALVEAGFVETMHAVYNDENTGEITLEQWLYEMEYVFREDIIVIITEDQEYLSIGVGYEGVEDESIFFSIRY